MTRMWMVNPKIMCRQHLLGEHKELHQIIGTIRLGHSIQGYLDNGLVEPHNILRRHAKLVEEMKERGYNHNSPISKSDRLMLLKMERKKSKLNIIENLQELQNRCIKCKNRIEQYQEEIHEKYQKI